MALSDNPKEKEKPRRKNRAIDAGSNFRWSDKQKLEAVNSYLALGNLALTSRVLGIPEITLRVWKASEWWKLAVDDIKMQERVELSNRMKKLVEAAHTIVAQRLEHGDPVVTPKGDVVMKPVSMKDAHKVATDLLDRRKLVEGGEEAVTDENKDNKLEKLAERFAEMATKSIKKQLDAERTIEGDITDAVYDERETGLQEGIRQVSFSTGSDQEEGREEQGTPDNGEGWQGS